MTLAEAKEIYGRCAEYEYMRIRASADGGATVCLDGYFTTEQLEAIVTVAKDECENVSSTG